MPELEDIFELEEEEDELGEVDVENAKLDKEEEEGVVPVRSSTASPCCLLIIAAFSARSHLTHRMPMVAPYPTRSMHWIHNVEEEQLKEDSSVAGPPAVPPRKMYDDDVQVALEMKMQFDDRASTSADEVCKKLYMWEMKLLQELKEKIRALFVQKYDEQKFLKLATKISVAIQVIIKSISNKINKLRDEELWPQTHDVYANVAHHVRMLSDPMPCLVSQAKNIDSTIAVASFGEAQIDLVKQLELQLLDLTTSFVVWFRKRVIPALGMNG
ncbi:hypothetical protein EJB05_43140, partial [Eragrostis curvula]